MSSILGAGEFGQCAPTAADIKKRIARLETNFLTDNCQLVVLKLFECLFFVNIADKTGSVDHAGTEEPTVEVIAAVVVIADLFFVFDELARQMRFT